MIDNIILTQINRQNFINKESLFKQLKEIVSSKFSDKSDMSIKGLFLNLGISKYELPEKEEDTILLLKKIYLLVNEFLSYDEILKLTNEKIEVVFNVFINSDLDYNTYKLLPNLTKISMSLEGNSSYKNTKNIDDEFKRIYLNVARSVIKDYGTGILPIGITLDSNGNIDTITDIIFELYNELVREPLSQVNVNIQPTADFFLKINRDAAKIEKHIGFFNFLYNYYKGLYSKEQNNIANLFTTLGNTRTYFRFFQTSESDISEIFTGYNFDFTEDDEPLIVYSVFLKRLIAMLSTETIN